MKNIFRIIVLFLLAFKVSADEYVVMDDETESFLMEIVENIKKALCYEGEIKVYILSDRTINAAATLSGDVIVNAGAITQSENLHEFIAIVAHEVGHISGQHVQLFLAHSPDFMKAGLVPALIGAVASLCAGNVAPLMAGVVGGQSVSQRLALSKLRQKENIADTKAAEAVKKLGWPVFDGFVSVHKKLAEKSVIFNKYLSTHPQSSERIGKYQRYLKEEKDKPISNSVSKQMKELQSKFEVVKMKIDVLTTQKEFLKTLYRNPKDSNEEYAKSIIEYRLGNYKAAEKLTSKLINDSNDDTAAYRAEIHCMSLINLKRCKEAAEIAKTMLQKIRKLQAHRDLVVIYAEAVIAGNLTKHAESAIKYLQRIVHPHDDDLIALTELGKLYTMTNQQHKASWCAAQTNLQIGDMKLAEIHAKRALTSPDPILKRKAQDILDSINEKEREKGQ